MVENDNLMVTVNCLVYNHEPFLRQCLDGFVMQKTTFKFEVIVHDDASTDRSADIIREYAERYPNIIRPVFEKENQYSKGVTRELLHIIFVPKCSSKYIAYCEGDDYWTDPLKLQTQVDFMERHPEFVVSSHLHDVYNERTKELFHEDSFCNFEYITENKSEYFEYTYFDGWFTHPLTCMYRNEKVLRDIPAEKYPYFIDTVFFYYVLRGKKGALLNNNMAVYRIHDGGIYSGAPMLNNYKRNISNLFLIYKVEGERRVLNALVYNESRCVSYYLVERRFRDAINEFSKALLRLPLRYYKSFFGSIYYNFKSR